MPELTQIADDGLSLRSGWIHNDYYARLIMGLAKRLTFSVKRSLSELLVISNMRGLLIVWPCFQSRPDFYQILSADYADYAESRNAEA